jgi:glycyl-tRNA synthetase
VTVDFETLNDHAVTIRHRDSTEQERVKVGELAERLTKLVS